MSDHRAEAKELRVVADLMDACTTAARESRRRIVHPAYLTYMEQWSQRIRGIAGQLDGDGSSRINQPTSQPAGSATITAPTTN